MKRHALSMTLILVIGALLAAPTLLASIAVFADQSAGTVNFILDVNGYFQ
jgi:hypothetical protein